MISGKEAFNAAIDGISVEYIVQGDNNWCDFNSESWSIDELNSSDFGFRLKPRTTTINGVECGKLVSSQWSEDEPNKVKLEFHNEDDARYFQTKAIDIFNINKG